MSKGAKDEKSLRRIINKTSHEDKKLNYEGSLPINKHIKSLFAGNNKIEICKIIECRLLPEYDSQKEKNEYSYEYYVNYIDHDRRNDTWIKRGQIILDDAAIETELKLREQRDKELEKLNEGHNRPEDPEIEKLHQEATKVKTIDHIILGKYKCDTWYYSPYPEGYHVKTLLLCEFCLNFYVDQSELERHCLKCPLKHPPGNEIYRDGNISMFEVDGKKEHVYCENLCFRMELLSLDGNIFWYIMPQTRSIKDEENTRIITENVSMYPLHTNGFTPLNENERVAFNLIKQNKIFYCSNSCGSDFEQVLKHYRMK